VSNKRKGIILSGGTGSRLFPITQAVCKQLVPVYDKPMVYYPLSTLMLAGIQDILIITTPRDKNVFFELLGDGRNLGINIEYATQTQPEGIAQAFIIGRDFINDSPSALILGDNIFYGEGLADKLQNCVLRNEGATVLAYPVRDPERYAVVEFDNSNRVKSLEEKPKSPSSRLAITGLYFYDNTVYDRANELIPSSRGELEITDINNSYLTDNQLWIEQLGRGMAWLDTGTFDSLHEAGSYIRTIEHRQDLKVGCPEEVAWRMGYIKNKQLKKLAKPLYKSGYGTYLLNLLKEHKSNI